MAAHSIATATTAMGLGDLLEARSCRQRPADSRNRSTSPTADGLADSLIARPRRRRPADSRNWSMSLTTRDSTSRNLSTSPTARPPGISLPRQQPTDSPNRSTSPLRPAPVVLALTAMIGCRAAPLVSRVGNTGRTLEAALNEKMDAQTDGGCCY